jgi:hypothetical protein
MTEYLIEPPKSRWEKFQEWRRSWSPQVKQGLIIGIITIALTVGGWFVIRSKSGSSIATNTGIAATNVSGSAIVQGNGNTVTVNNSSHNTRTQGIPNLPQISIETFDGLPSEFTNNPHLRLHRLSVRNNSDVTIETFCSRLQLPEPILQTVETNATVGTLVAWRAMTNKLLIKGNAGKNEGGLWIGPTSMVAFVEQPMAFFPRYANGELGELSRGGDITGVWELTIDRLPPGGNVSLSFLSSDAREATNYIRFAATPLWSSHPNPQTIPDTNELRYSFEGDYLYPSEGTSGRQHFLVPLHFNDRERFISSLPIQRENSPWHTVILEFQ